MGRGARFRDVRPVGGHGRRLGLLGVVRRGRPTRSATSRGDARRKLEDAPRRARATSGARHRLGGHARPLPALQEPEASARHPSSGVPSRVHVPAAARGRRDPRAAAAADVLGRSRSAIAPAALVVDELEAAAPVEPSAVTSTAIAAAPIARREDLGAQRLERQRPPAGDGRAVAAQRVHLAGERLSDERPRVALAAARRARRLELAAVVVALVAARTAPLARVGGHGRAALAADGGRVRSATLHGKRLA